MDRYDGFEEFVLARGGALSRTAFLLTGDHHTAQDLVQTALAKAAQRWRQIIENGQPEAYVRRIIVNERISWWRRRPPNPVEWIPDQPGPDEPHQIVERLALGQALATLTPRQRAVLVLRYYEDLSEAETAAAMGCSVGTVKSQTSVALNNLRLALPHFADQAGQYADAGAAVATARRKRTRRVSVVAAALVLVPLLLAVAVYALGAPGTAPPPLTPSPSVSPSPWNAPPGASPMLPQSLPAAGAVLPGLPQDRGVGRAALIRTSRSGSFRQLQIAAESGWFGLRLPEDTQSILLSPDGRWLSWSDRRTTALVHDLTTGQRRRVPGEVVAWSRLGDWLLVGNNYPGRPQLISLTGGASHVVADTAGWNDASAVLDTGEVLRTDAQRAGGDHAFPLAVFDPRKGALRRLSIDVGALLGTDEHVRDFAGFPVVVPVRDGVAAVQVYSRRFAHPAAFIEFSLRDGSPLRRLDLGSRAESADPATYPCLQGEIVSWNDGTRLHQTAPGATDVAVFDMHAGFAYQLPGCRPDTGMRTVH
ncbi:hypothetical protein Cci01nite_41750 [Catellatospora citrea]|uniref:RNA polymerase sigma-70 factor (Sigma-E family) n=1 Tax=Catellatospora citrea TaxID=53366 RepID=A0A8J3K9G5_9ACTN|nr:SigE family RNA polymerase sigma factor [Catellatospora citrea]RKE10414.1 RNA polymerase sigma-70 factor (sigma-E family) [Catellatospora citrea]GIF99081.1 hypothetical protein Cci01nite_41750 [Catellatospora citrea]